MREGAGGLARPGWHVDPGAVEEAPADRGQFRGEGVVGGEDPLLGLGPGDRAVLLLRQGRVAVPVLQLLQTQPLRLHRVVAVRQARIARAHGGDQRVHHLVLDHVGAVAGRSGARVVAPVVDDLLVLGERVGDQRKQRDTLAEGRGDALGRRLAHRAVPVGKLVQRGGDGEVLLPHPHLHGGDGLIEQAVPGGAAGDLLLVQQLLQLVGKLVRTEHPQVAQPGAPSGQSGGFRQLGLQHGILQPVQLQRQEQQVAADVGRPLLHGLVEAAVFRLRGIAREKQLGEGQDPPQDLLHRLVAPDRRRQGIAGQAGELSGGLRLQRLRLRLRTAEIGVELRVVDPRIEVRQVPFRQGLAPAAPGPAGDVEGGAARDGGVG